MLVKLHCKIFDLSKFSSGSKKFYLDCSTIRFILSMATCLTIPDIKFQPNSKPVFVTPWQQRKHLPGTSIATPFATLPVTLAETFSSGNNFHCQQIMQITLQSFVWTLLKKCKQALTLENLRNTIRAKDTTTRSLICRTRAMAEKQIIKGANDLSFGLGDSVKR